MIEIRLPVLDATGQRSVEEILPAEALSSGRYRLLASPGLVDGLAAGDELDAAVAELSGSTWCYGNVSDPREADRPLGWWEIP